MPKVQEYQSFLDGAIHSLRAPLRGIGTSAAMLSRKWEDRFDAESRELLGSILHGVTCLNDLTRELADYSMALGPKDSACAPLPVSNALQSALAGLETRIRETGASVHTEALPRLDADHEQLSVLFRCLIGNALQYRNTGTAPRIEIDAIKEGDEWRFAVSDNGIGIAPRFQRQIFEPFQRIQRHPDGFGLGLAICRQIVTAHGGRIWVESQEGEGSTFFFTLPAAGGGSD